MQNTHTIEHAQVSNSGISNFPVEEDDADPRTYGLEPADEQPHGEHGSPVVEGPRPKGDCWRPNVAEKQYKSTRAIRLAAWHCTHSKIDGIDKSLLAYLAEHSSGTSGGNAYPGNRNISNALGLTDSPTDARIAKLISFGLIERTFTAIGRKKASVYRLCLESEYFPTRTPGGEWLVQREPPSVRFMRAINWLPKEQFLLIVRWLANDRSNTDKRNDLSTGQNLPACMSPIMREALLEMSEGWMHQC